MITMLETCRHSQGRSLSLLSPFNNHASLTHQRRPLAIQFTSTERSKSLIVLVLEEEAPLDGYSSHD